MVMRSYVAGGLLFEIYCITFFLMKRCRAPLQTNSYGLRSSFTRIFKSFYLLVFLWSSMISLDVFKRS